jgi:hypothetical protein
MSAYKSEFRRFSRTRFIHQVSDADAWTKRGRGLGITPMSASMPPPRAAYRQSADDHNAAVVAEEPAIGRSR